MDGFKKNCEPWPVSVIITLPTAFFSDTLFHILTTLLGRLDKLLTFFVLHEHAGTCNKFFKPIDGAINTFVIFNFNSDHVNKKGIDLIGKC